MSTDTPLEHVNDPRKVANAAKRLRKAKRVTRGTLVTKRPKRVRRARYYLRHAAVK